MTVDVVISRYNEPLDFLPALPPEWRVFIYDKSPVSLDDPRTIRRPNIGREAETFCYHNLTVRPEGYTIYLQGDCIDHYPGAIEQAKWIMQRQDRVGWLGAHYDTAWNVPPHRVEDLGMDAVWETLFPGETMPSRFEFPAGAQMVVWRDNVMARSQSWWRLAWELLQSEDWRVAHCFERLWPKIYGGK